MHAYSNLHAHLRTHAYIDTLMHISATARTLTRTHTYTHTQTHTHTHTHTHIHTYVHTCFIRVYAQTDAHMHHEYMHTVCTNTCMQTCTCAGHVHPQKRVVTKTHAHSVHREVHAGMHMCRPCAHTYKSSNSNSCTQLSTVKHKRVCVQAQIYEGLAITVYMHRI
jgi:hypothetical protein